jgi:hypothetical protein
VVAEAACSLISLVRRQIIVGQIHPGTTLQRQLHNQTNDHWPGGLCLFLCSHCGCCLLSPLCTAVLFAFPVSHDACVFWNVNPCRSLIMQRCFLCEHAGAGEQAQLWDFSTAPAFMLVIDLLFLVKMLVIQRHELRSRFGYFDLHATVWSLLTYRWC